MVLRLLNVSLSLGQIDELTLALNTSIQFRLLPVHINERDGEVFIEARSLSRSIVNLHDIPKLLKDLFGYFPQSTVENADLEIQREHVGNMLMLQSFHFSLEVRNHF